MFRKKMSSNVVIGNIIDLFSQVFMLMAVATMVVSMYIIAKECLTFAMSHIVRYILCSVLVPFRTIPGIGPVVNSFIEGMKVTDAEAYEAFNSSVF